MVVHFSAAPVVQHVAALDMLVLESEYDIMRGMDFSSSGELWFSLDKGLTTSFHVYDEDESRNFRRAGYARFDRIWGLAFDDEDHLWFAEQRGEKFHLHEIQDTATPDDDGGFSISSYDRLDSSVGHGQIYTDLVLGSVDIPMQSSEL